MKLSDLRDAILARIEPLGPGAEIEFEYEGQKRTARLVDRTFEGVAGPTLRRDIPGVAIMLGELIVVAVRVNKLFYSFDAYDWDGTLGKYDATPLEWAPASMVRAVAQQLDHSIASDSDLNAKAFQGKSWHIHNMDPDVVKQIKMKSAKLDVTIAELLKLAVAALSRGEAH